MDENQIAETHQYLTFILGEEEFALEIAKAREVVDYTNITRIPRMPEHLLGVINLRGNVVSVIDLRSKLGIGVIKETVNACIVIVEVNKDGDMLQMGVLADSVREVLHLDPDQIEPPPKVGTKLNPEFIRGIGKQDDHFVIILDIDKMFDV